MFLERKCTLNWDDPKKNITSSTEDYMFELMVRKMLFAELICSYVQEELPPTDSRLRPDQRCLENGEYEMANAEKQRLEQRQRQARKMQERGWRPQWFAKDKGSDAFRYVGGYWEAREEGNWISCPDIFGHFSTDQVVD